MAIATIKIRIPIRALMWLNYIGDTRKGGKVSASAVASVALLEWLNQRTDVNLSHCPPFGGGKGK